MKVTDKQMETLVAYADAWASGRSLPTVRELCVLFGLRSTCTVFNRIKRLRDLGLLEAAGSRHRATAPTLLGLSVALGRKGGLFSQQPIYCQACGRGMMVGGEAWEKRTCSRECREELERRHSLAMLGEPYWEKGA